MRKTILLLVLLPILVLSVGKVQATVVGIGPNVDVPASNDLIGRQQVEPTIAVDPRDPNIVVAGAQDYRLVATGGHRWHGYYRSTDGGNNWSVSLVPGFPGDTSPEGLASPLQSFNAASDPVLAFDRSGNVYYVGVAFVIQPNGSCCFSSTLFVAKYVNDGASYAGVSLVGGVTDADKPWIAVDSSGGANDGNVYVAFDATISTPSGPIFTSVFSRSIDGGQSFSTPVTVPEGCGSFPLPNGCGVFPGVTVDTAGNVFVATLGYNPTTDTVLNFIQVSKLTNGGALVAGTTVAAGAISLEPSPLPGGSFRAFTLPQIAADSNGVYLVWDDFGTGDANVLFARSRDNGVTWSAPMRVNDGAPGQQFFATIAVSGGIISVAWYDSRLNTGATMTALDVFYAQSVNSGATFSSNLRVTSVSFNPNIVLRTDPPGAFRVFLGDYIHIAASPSAVHPIWTDNRDACDSVDPTFGCVDQDVFSASISVALPPPDFGVSASPSSLTVPQESSSTSTIIITSVSGFSGTITLSASVTPALKQGPFATLSSTNVFLSSGGSATVLLTVKAKGATTLGSYSVTVTASSGNLSHNVTVPVNVVREQTGT